jgi:hypothetical protein
VSGGVFFFGKISSKFDLKNMILTYAKEFPWKKTGPN